MIMYAVKSRIGTYYNFLHNREEFNLVGGCLDVNKKYVEYVARHLVSDGSIEVYELTLKETLTPETKPELPELNFSVG